MYGLYDSCMVSTVVLGLQMSVPLHLFCHCRIDTNQMECDVSGLMCMTGWPYLRTTWSETSMQGASEITHPWCCWHMVWHWECSSCVGSIGQSTNSWTCTIHQMLRYGCCHLQNDHNQHHHLFMQHAKMPTALTVGVVPSQLRRMAACCIVWLWLQWLGCD